MEEVFKKIKELRIKNDLTLVQLSKKTGLSVSFLSQIERGTTNLAITSLKKIADAFDLNMTYFFGKEESSSYLVADKQQKKLRIEGIEEELTRLNGSFNGRELEPFHVKVLPKTVSTHKFTHQGEEFYYVLTGEITFMVDDQFYIVKQGESIHFPSYLPHNFENKTEETIEMIIVVIPRLL
ncbi:helix-turn-helix domain-containing protein [Virgibacillus oceani]